MTKKPSGPHLNIKTIFPRYGDSHGKDKTVGETVLSRTLGRARQAPGVWDRFIPA